MAPSNYSDLDLILLSVLISNLLFSSQKILREILVSGILCTPCCNRSGTIECMFIMVTGRKAKSKNRTRLYTLFLFLPLSHLKANL